MTLSYQRLSDRIAVAAQLAPEAMAEVAAAGFKSVINNRPDHEGGPDQPTSASVEAAALAAGLQYAWQPVAPSLQTEDDIARFAELVARLPQPILAYCRSGTRSGRLARAAGAA
jgi:uncharacterized protein (TIGR01244 family)